MSNKGRVELSDESMETINGGVFSWDPEAGKMTYIHGDFSTTVHKINDYDNAWYWSNQLHSQNVPEDEILARLQKKGWID